MRKPRNEVAMFATASYNVYATIRANPQAMKPVKCSTSNGGVQTLENISFLELTWMSCK